MQHLLSLIWYCILITKYALQFALQNELHKAYENDIIDKWEEERDEVQV